MAYKRAGRPTQALRDSLRGLVASDYLKLLQAVVEACLDNAGKNDRPKLVVAVHHLTQFAPDFPKGVCFKEEGPTDYRRMNARKVLDWLRKHGHTTLTVDDIGNAATRHTHMMKDIFNGLL